MIRHAELSLLSQLRLTLWLTSSNCGWSESVMQCGVASCHQHKSPLSTAAPSSFKSGVVQAAGRTDLGSPAWLRVATGSPAYEHPRSLLLGACLARATQALLVTFAASSQFEGPRRYSRQQHSVRVCVNQRLPLDVYALIRVYAWINSRWSAVLPFFPICCLHCGASCRRVRFHCTPLRDCWQIALAD